MLRARHGAIAPQTAAAAPSERLVRRMRPVSASVGRPNAEISDHQQRRKILIGSAAAALLPLRLLLVDARSAEAAVEVSARVCCWQRPGKVRMHGKHRCARFNGSGGGACF